MNDFAEAIVAAKREIKRAEEFERMKLFDKAIGHLDEARWQLRIAMECLEKK